MRLSVSNEAAQSALPEGWTLLTLPRGPFAGANVILSFIDRALAWDADGNPASPATSRHMTLLSFALREGEKAPRVFVTHILTDDVAHDPYSLASPAVIGRTSSLTDMGSAPPERHEEWSVSTGDGHTLSLTLCHEAGTPARSTGEIASFSAAAPDFHRIYRFEQLDDLAMSEGAGRSLKGEVTLQSSIPELAAYFDGTEKIVAIVSRPYYRRDVIEP